MHGTLSPALVFGRPTTLNMMRRFGVGRAETFQKAGAQTPPIYPRINFSIGLEPPPMQKPEPVLKQPAPQQPAPPPVCFPYTQSDEHSGSASQLQPSYLPCNLSAVMSLCMLAGS